MPLPVGMSKARYGTGSDISLASKISKSVLKSQENVIYKEMVYYIPIMTFDLETWVNITTHQISKGTLVYG